MWKAISVSNLTLSSLRFFSAKAEKPFDKILIANRGEIACRVMRTAKRLGVKTVAIYSDADASSMHVKMADEAYWVGPPASKDSYLRMDRILEVAKKSGAQGIHPGYGFLSENAKFVDMVEAAGIAFIGPSSAPMNAMGDKINSKKIAIDAGCFTIPGFQGEVPDEQTAVKLANEVGYPVMIKASAGGGGKGMRVAYTDDEVREGFRLSKAEALSSFGDDRMLIERFIENPHHIEIQVLADTHGNVVAFPERECSVQRRNQKVVEESPSCLLTPETRRAMQEQAIKLCKATGYRSAGTVEMLADEKQNFYFLEMNTRLQVEHPITELVSGEDLVEHMLWIAAGKPLPQRLTSVQCLPFRGSAIESRVYAEDPLRNFLPSIGPLITYKEPQLYASDKGTVRIDTGVFEGATISMHYDPMIAKLCTHALTREEAIEKMETALDQYVVQGLGNNLTFLRSVMRNKKFRTGKYSTKFIPEEYPEGFKGVELSTHERNQTLAIAAMMQHARDERSNANNPATQSDDYDYAQGSEYVVVLGGPTGTAFATKIGFGEEGVIAEITPLGGKDKKAEIVHIHNLEWAADEHLAHVFLPEEKESKKKAKKHEEEEDDQVPSMVRSVQFLGRIPEGFILRYLGCEQKIIVRTPEQHKLSAHMLAPEKKDFSKFLLCPMPGTLISVSVKEGQKVEAGQQLAVVEAMKMQNVLRAEKKGVVKALKKAAGSHLKVDEVIIEFE